MSFIDEFVKRGYLYQSTDLEGLKKISDNKPIVAYVGFDVTAQSLHVGNLMQVMIMRLLQQKGHKPIIIVGGATTKIGDPTGKDQMRKMLSDEQLDINITGVKKSLAKFLNFGNKPSDALLLNNSDWLDKIGYIEFLRDYGRNFSVNRMLTMESAKARLEKEQHLSFLEFNYMLLQGFDFYYLNKHHNCSVQFGGSDQWGNIVMGVDFINKMHESEVLPFGVTTPLLTTSSGAKMGKTEKGAIWLNDDMISSYDYFQYWRNTEDLDLIKFAKLYSEYTDEEFEEFELLATQNINQAKESLAYKLTSLCRGEDEAKRALSTAKDVFLNQGISENLPTIELSMEILKNSINVVELLHLADNTYSKSAIKKLIQGGGIKINNTKLEDEHSLINEGFIIEDKYIKIAFGKKKHMLIKLV